MDRSGKEISQEGNPGEYGSTALSPDGGRLAVSIRNRRSDKSDIWVRDLGRGVTSRLTFDDADHRAPLWSPDGSEIVFSSDAKGTQSLYAKNASGTGTERELWSCEERLSASDWSRDGRFIAVNRLSKKNSWDIWIFPTDGKTKPFEFVKGRFIEVFPVFSPDGRYVAYMSTETNRAEIYVQQFPGPGGKWQVSADGGTEPHWSGDGRTLYFRSPDSKLMAAPVRTVPAFSAGVPRALFPIQVQAGARRNGMLVSSDGQKFLFLSPLGREGIAPMTVILHWPAALTN